MNKLYRWVIILAVALPLFLGGCSDVFEDNVNQDPNNTGNSTTLSENFTFTCAFTGVTTTVTVSAKTAVCLAAKKFFAQTMTCNTVADFSIAQNQCTSACGRPDCLEF